MQRNLLAGTCAAWTLTYRTSQLPLVRCHSRFCHNVCINTILYHNTEMRLPVNWLVSLASNSAITNMHEDSTIVQRTSTARMRTNDKSCNGVIDCRHHHCCTLAVLHPACFSLAHYSLSAWDLVCCYGPCQFVSLSHADHPCPHQLEKKKAS